MTRDIGYHYASCFLATVPEPRNKQSIPFLLNSPVPDDDIISSSTITEGRRSPIDDLDILVDAACAASPPGHPPSTAIPPCAPSKIEPATAVATSRPVPSLPRCGRVEKKRRRRPSVPCDLCGRLFGEVAAVRKHIRVVHEKVKDFECNICNRRFAEKSNLKKHIVALHEHERAHRCDYCGKMFNFTDGLRRHINNCHLGLRPYSCDLCDSTFKQRTHLQKHQQSVHHMPLAALRGSRGRGRRWTH